jgi:hypothetical protein
LLMGACPIYLSVRDIGRSGGRGKQAEVVDGVYAEEAGHGFLVNGRRHRRGGWVRGALRPRRDNARGVGGAHGSDGGGGQEQGREKHGGGEEKLKDVSSDKGQAFCIHGDFRPHLSNLPPIRVNRSKRRRLAAQ